MFSALIPSSIHQSRIPQFKIAFFSSIEHFPQNHLGLFCRTTNEKEKKLYSIWTYPRETVEKLFFDNNDVEIESPMYQQACEKSY